MLAQVENCVVRHRIEIEIAVSEICGGLYAAGSPLLPKESEMHQVFNRLINDLSI
jgi:hypothetical protein